MSCGFVPFSQPTWGSEERFATKGVQWALFGRGGVTAPAPAAPDQIRSDLPPAHRVCSERGRHAQTATGQRC